MRSDVSVRVGTVADAEAISALVHKVAPGVGYGTPQQTAAFLDLFYSASAIAEDISTGLRTFLVATVGEELVGCVYFGRSSGYFGGLYVTTPGEGLGRALMGALLGAAASDGVAQLRGDVLASNTGMLRLAQHHGFAVTQEYVDEQFMVGQRFVVIEAEVDGGTIS